MEEISQSAFEQGIADIKAEFKTMLIRRKELVEKLGLLCESFVKRKNVICEEIKNILADEIREHLITERLINLYCKPEWKNEEMNRNRQSSDERISSKRRSENTTTSEIITAVRNGNYIAESVREEIEIPKGTALINEWELESLRKTQTQMAREIDNIKKKYGKAEMDLLAQRELISSLRKAIDEKDAEVKQQKVEVKEFRQTVLTDFVPILNDVIKTAHHEVCPSKCGTWRKANKLKVRKF